MSYEVVYNTPWIHNSHSMTNVLQLNPNSKPLNREKEASSFTPYMLEAIIRGRRGNTTTNLSSFSALIAFEPRQVTLVKHHQQQQLKIKNKKMSSETLEVDSIGEIVVEKSTQKSKKKKKRSKNSSPLLHSIANYLENKGFAKALSALKAEASIEELDGLKEHTLDLEEMYTKYLETSKCDGKMFSDGSKKLDSQKEEDAEEDKGAKCDAAVEIISKVKRKQRNENDVDVVNDQHGVSNGITKEKKKKTKLVSDSSDKNTREVGSEAAQGPADTMVLKAQVEDLDKKHKDKKKKKNKRTSETLTENVEQIVVEALPKVSIDKTSGEEKIVKSKDKKRKKSKSTSEDDVEKLEREDSEKTNSSKEEKSSKKRKRSGAEENESQSDDKIVPKESKHSNNKGSEEKGVGEGQIPKADVLQEGDGHAGKKRKTEHGQEEADQQANGKYGSAKKQYNGSAEPKTINAFKRVDVEKVEFINEKLQDNSYWAKDGADSGYGAKAQEVLGQVRGRDFRHEKTKKKRGSYRGGQIDLQSHSFKFDNSDDE